MEHLDHGSASTLEMEQLRNENEQLRAELEHLRREKPSSSKSIDQIWMDIEGRLDARPSFFSVIEDAPAIVENLWRQTEFAYLDNPLPALLKERLFAYLSRFCSVSYCISRHCAFLLRDEDATPPGTSDALSAEDVVGLLSRPVPTSADIQEHLAVLADIHEPLDRLPEMDSPVDQALFGCVVAVYLETEERTDCLDALQSVLGRERFGWLLQLLAYIRMAHFWVEAHPDIQSEEHIDHVLAEHQVLMDWISTYRTHVHEELRQRLDRERIELEITRDRIDQLHKTNQELRRSREAVRQAKQDAEEHRAQLERELRARMSLERKLREREERLRLALSAGNMGTWDLDMQTSQAFIDAQEAELLGFEPRDQYVAQEQFFDRLHPDDLQAKIEAYDRGVDYESEFRVVHPDGKVRWLASTTKFVFDAEGEPIRALGVNFDITERKRHEAAVLEAKELAETANRSKSQFLANMSHEIRTPLTAIIGFASLLARKLTGKELSYLEKIERNGRRLLETLDAILTLARLEAEALEVELFPVLVAEEVQRVADLFQERASDKNISLTHRIATEATRAHARVDQGALNSILQNVISNAIKFTDEGSVTVETYLSERSTDDGQAVPLVSVRIADTGCGIDESFLPHLFDSFEQESKGFARQYEGSGLGLSITSQLITLMDGQIEVSSRKGEGSTFTISFPCLVNDAGDKVEAAAP